MAASESSDPKAELRAFLVEARRLRDDYETAFQKYKTDGQVNRLIGAFGVEAAYEYYGIPKGISREAVDGFLKRWEASEPYRGFRQRFEALLDRVGTFLGGVSEIGPSLRAPGNSPKLLAKLNRVRNAVRLDTKMRYMIAVLQDLDARGLVKNKDIPARRSRPSSATRRSRTQPAVSAADPGLAWTTLGVILGVFLALS